MRWASGAGVNDRLDAQQTLELAVVSGALAIDPDAWDRLAGDNPFVRHAWLAAMERSGAVDPDRGWAPHFVTAREPDGTLVGAVPLYLKGHSFGEYVYDWAWADLAQRVGVEYYPKLIAASPFSPVTGPRLLVDPDAEDPTRIEDALVSASIRFAATHGVHGVHLLFLTADVAKRMGDQGLIVRQAHQYHWRNEGYATFDDFLARFRSKRRREVRRERRRLAEAGYTVTPVEGANLTDADVEALFGFYASTCERYMWGRQYLDRPFFEEVRATMPENIVAMLARDADGELVAGTFNLRTKDRLFGRYWGCDRDVPFLHFETCYYRTIEYAIAEGIQVVEPGAGGDHKYARGFNPETMYSAHWLADARLAQILARATERECHVVNEMVEDMHAQSPLRSEGLPDDD